MYLESDNVKFGLKMVQVKIFKEFLKRPYKFRKLGFFLALKNESHEPKKVRKP